MAKLITKLVYFEPVESWADALKQEKQVKKWYKQWKIELIESINPDWDDLYFQVLVEFPAFGQSPSPIKLGTRL